MLIIDENNNKSSVNTDILLRNDLINKDSIFTVHLKAHELDFNTLFFSISKNSIPPSFNSGAVSVIIE
jgi:hypothetical protein